MKTPENPSDTRPLGALLQEESLGAAAKFMFLFVMGLFLLPASLGTWIVGAMVIEEGRVKGSTIGLFLGLTVVMFLLTKHLVWLVRGFDLRQRVYKNAYEFTWRGTTRVTHFDDIVSVHDDSWVGNGRPGVFLASFMLKLPGGATISTGKDSSFRGLHHSRHRMKRIYGAMMAAWEAHRGERDLRRLKSGEICHYGRFQVQGSGLTMDGEPIAKSRLTKAVSRCWLGSMWGIELVVDGTPRRVPTKEIDDFPAFIFVMRHVQANA